MKCTKIQKKSMFSLQFELKNKDALNFLQRSTININ